MAVETAPGEDMENTVSQCYGDADFHPKLRSWNSCHHALTRVSLAFIEGRINVYLRFGRPVRVRRTNDCRSAALFRAKQVFCRVHWTGNEYGTARWQLMVLQAGKPQNVVQRIGGIHPGARILLHVEGHAKVRSALDKIDSIEGLQVHPADVSPDYWSALGNRLNGRGLAPEYSMQRHGAWLSRRSLR
jgi:Protein of unknown function (DUF2840)